MSEDLLKVETLAQTYFDGFYEGDADKLASIFHSEAVLTQVVDESPKTTHRDTWLTALRNRPSPASNGAKRHDRILSIDLCGPTLALLKVTCAVPPRHFTDLLSCIKVENRWLIAQKVFMTETREG